MPDVGVLQLTIRDNSEQAGQGLGNLADALSRVQAAINGGLKLSGMSRSLNSFAKSVAENSKTLSNIGTFLNAITSYSKAFKELEGVTFNAQPIKDLKEAVGEGIKIGQAGTQINNLRVALSGEWNAENAIKASQVLTTIGEGASALKGTNLSTSAKGISAIAKALDEYASAATHIKDAAGVNVSPVGNAAQGAQAVEAGQNVTTGLAQGAESEKSEVLNIIKEIAGAMIDAAKEKLDIHSPSGVFEDIGRNTMLGLKNGLVDTKSEVQGAAEEVADQLSKQFYTKLNIMEVIDKPLGYLTDIYRTTASSMKEYESGVNAVLPKVQKMSSEEMMVATHARLAKEAINGIISTLDKPINYKGLSEVVNVMTGVTTGSQGGIINESTTLLGALVDEQSALERTNSTIDSVTDAQVKLNEAGEAYAGTIQIFDEAEGIWKRIYTDTENVNKGAEQATDTIANVAEQAKNVVNLTQIPASGKNGAFANAAEEARYLQDEIEKTIASQQQWDSIYKAAAKQAKYGGSMKPDDIAFDMKHAPEEYDIAYEAEVRLRDAFAELLEYSKEYNTTAENTVQIVNEQASSMQNLSASIETMAAQAAANSTAINQIFDALNNPPQFRAADYINQSMGIGADVKSAEDSYRAFLDLMGQETPQANTLAELNPEMANLKQQMDDAGISANQFTSRMVDLDGELKRKKPDAESAANGINKFGFSLKDLKKGMKSAFPLLAQLRSRLKSIIIRRTLTAALRKVVSSAKEGLQNVYEYSKLIGSGFSSSMDDAASSLAQMKNALGAALAPAVQMLIPLLQQVVSWFINLVNYANQFFALLNGQKTWTRALPQTVSAFDKQKKAAKGAGAAIKDLLADWDELNIIQSESSGGGGAGTTAAEDYLKMFEEVGRFDNKIKDVVNFIKDNFDTILNVAEMIGAAILAWKISKIFGDSLSSLQRLSMVTGLVLTIAGIKLTTSAAEDIAKNGLNAENALKAAGGIAATALGGAFILGAAAKALGFSMAGGAVMGAITGVAIGMGFLISTIHAKTIENAYGTLEEDAETIKKNVMAYFNPEAEALVSVRNAALEDEEGAVKKVGESLAVLEKDYPIAVTLKDKESIDQLQLDIGNLVLEAKALVLKRKQNTRDLILNSGQFDDAESFIKFSDLQWDKTAQYIEGLGEQMGELISRGITSGAELDGLQEKLSRIIHAAMYGQRSGEYAGKVSMAGETLRRAGYTKDTVSNYIDTFLSERGYYEDQARADALAQQAELKALWATVEERYNAGEAGVTQNDVDYARSKYESFDVNKEVDRLLDLYLGEGNKLFAKDLFEGLSAIIEKTKDDWVVKSARDYLEQASENKLGLDATGYLSDLNGYIYNLIEKSTGQDKEKMRKLFEASGLNPLDYLGEFGQTIKDKIADTLINGRWNGGPWFSNEEIEAIAKQFNIDLKDYTKVKVQPQFEIEDKAKLAVDLYKEIEDIINTSGLPTETISIFKDRLSQVADLQTLQSLKTFIDQNGLTDAMVMLKNFLQGDGWTRGDGGVGTGVNATGVVRNPERITGRGMSISDVGWGNNSNANADVITEQDLTKAVASGTETANRNQNDILNSIMRGVEALLRKNWTVNITPTSALGSVNRGAAAAIERITGTIG